MIRDKLRTFVERTFAHDVEFCKDVLLALQVDQNVVFLGQDRNRKPWEIMALKRIQQARDAGNMPEE
jgi:hypothetical protein